MRPASSERTRIPLVRLGALLAAVGLLSACGLPTPKPKPMGPPPELSKLRPGDAPSPDAPSSTPPVLDCPKSGLIAQAGPADAAMGLRVLTLELSNCGKERRVVNGYPDIRILDRDRKPVEVELERGAKSILAQENFDAGPVPVTLLPGQKAVAALAWRNTVDMTGSPVNGAYVSVAPVPGSARQLVPETIDLGTTGKLGLSAWAEPKR
ncbi:DUF4232 domain-containing protein [Streptomyces olivoreticuli]|uniref:DUF4232 domain-containing protein n=1 Tax=Streptomyces olivoreticuli TaxID=68246 RepID=UPI002658A454|nr:DUF4232 domain-containing protein [Streptomyces olivoreticuli]WKK25054.1 DUF4232 domain-containing protein [Streptomyces olivoreticuli]